MSSRRIALWLCALMCTVSLAATAVKQLTRLAKASDGIQLDSAIPKQFGSWRVDERQLVAVINPQTQQMLDRLYSQTLSRTYVDGRGYRIMLSLAYGSDQRGDLQAHKPEICYPAQGFALLANDGVEISTPDGPIPGRRLSTRLGNRAEPVTYWFTVNGHVVKSQWDLRWAELRLSLEGKAPNGLLFRVSSIDPDPASAYREHDRFVNELLASLAKGDRWQLSGLGARR